MILSKFGATAIVLCTYEVVGFAQCGKLATGLMNQKTTSRFKFDVVSRVK